MGYATQTKSPTVRMRNAWSWRGTNPTQSAFYKQFTRPFAKVLLIAVFTYQLTYWSWIKLETDEIRAEKDGRSLRQKTSEHRGIVTDESQATITSLEKQVDEYKKSKETDKAAKSS